MRNNGLQHVQQDREEMKHGPRDDEQMPDRVMIRKTAPHVEHGADRVEQPPDDQQSEPFGNEQRVQRFPGEDDQPAHQNVEQRRQHQELFCEERFEHDAGYRQPPDHPEQRPAKRATQSYQQKRRIRARDEQVDARMVECLEQILDLAFRKSVHKRRSCV